MLGCRIWDILAGTKSMQAPLDPAVKKAYEVGYALFRVAAILPSRSFAELLEKEALNLLRCTVADLSVEAQKGLATIHYLVAFGKDTDSIHHDNAKLLIQELESLASLLQDRARNAVSPADLSQIFSAADNFAASEMIADSRIAESIPARINRQKSVAVSPAALSERQAVILERIRQSGNCRTRDLQAALPDLSERTLRYDLQRLVEDGKIERGGGGGPASWYKIREASPQSNVSAAPSL